VRPAAAAAGGWRQVARNMHHSNGIIDARSASLTAPDLVAAATHCNSLQHTATHGNTLHLIWWPLSATKASGAQSL